MGQSRVAVRFPVPLVDDAGDRGYQRSRFYRGKLCFAQPVVTVMEIDHHAEVAGVAGQEAQMRADAANDRAGATCVASGTSLPRN